MKINELMIGDWGNIYIFPNENPKDKDLFPAKITAILTPTASESFGDTIECMFTALDGTGSVGYASRPPETFLPILLTSEILEKNGWHKYYFGTKDISDKVSINYELKNDHTLFLSHYPDEDCFCSVFGMKRIEIRYVHQLQHALRLCGIDKEVVL